MLASNYDCYDKLAGAIGAMCGRIGGYLKARMDYWLSMQILVGSVVDTRIRDLEGLSQLLLGTFAWDIC